MKRKAIVQFLIASFSGVAGIASPGALADEQVAGGTEVIVVGSMHQMHEELPFYTYDDLAMIVRQLEPDALCVELQPSDLESRPEEKNKREYPRAIYPLIDQHDYAVYAMEPAEPKASEIIKPMLAAISEFENKQPQASKTLDEFISATYEVAKAHWDSPASVNDAFTDDLFRTKHAVQHDMIGPVEAASWQAWNQHFLDTILAAANDFRGKRVVVIVGAEHGYWLRNRLRQEAGVLLLESPGLYDPAPGASESGK